MDTLTHALSGALCARASAPSRPGPDVLPLARRIVVGFLAAAFPDTDVVASYFGQLAWLYNHRGVTHSLLMLPLWAWLLSWLCALAWRRDRSWRAYFGVIALALGIHIVGDWITAFGTLIFAPFSDARFALSTTFIIDLWFSGIILVGLVASVVFRRSRMPAVLGLVVLSGYVGLQWYAQQQAIAFGAEYARASGLRPVAVTASPRPVSPFNWMVVVEEQERYHYALVNLVRREPRPAPDEQAGLIIRLDAVYLPLEQAQWVRSERFGQHAQAGLARTVWAHPDFAFFRWFARYPLLERVDSGKDATCVWFQDLRFFTPGRAAQPFRYGMCRASGEDWQPFQRLSESSRVPVR